MSNVCYELRDGGGNSLGYAPTQEEARDEAIKLVMTHLGYGATGVEVRVIRHEEVENVTVKDGWMLSVTQP